MHGTSMIPLTKIHSTNHKGGVAETETAATVSTGDQLRQAIGEHLGNLIDRNISDLCH